MNYVVIAQDVDALRDTQNAPAVSMGPYLVATDQLSLLTTISVYSSRGDTAGQARLLYMNAPALAVWRAMGHQPTIIGEQHRPPRTALIAFGVPFSE